MKPGLNKYDNINADDAQFISDIKAIVYTDKQKAYQAADLFQVAANWLVGRRIVEQEQHGRARAEYGKRIIEFASEALTAEYGKSYSFTQIKNFKKFYLLFSGLDIQQAPLAESARISQTLSDQSYALISSKSQTASDKFEIRYNIPNLSWSHYERLMRVKNDNERDWYMREAAGENCSVRTLNRNIGSQYYHRLLQTPESKRGEVIDEMQRLTADYQKDRHKFLRNPVIAEFLTESEGRYIDCDEDGNPTGNGNFKYNIDGDMITFNGAIEGNWTIIERTKNAITLRAFRPQEHKMYLNLITKQS